MEFISCLGGTEIGKTVREKQGALHVAAGIV